MLWGEFMNFNASNPKWSNRDRFVLANGHACALLYSMLHLSGYAVSNEDLQNFRQMGSQTPGHPENFVTPGVEVSTGPLGQGISNAVGLAMAERHLAATFNRDDFDVVDHFTYVICGDGCLQEGVSSEASSLAGHLGLGKLIVLYDDNLITIDGGTNLSFTEDVNMRYDSYGWHTQTVVDGTDVSSLRDAIANAKAETGRPSMIKIRTIIGHGSTMEGSSKVHGAPLSAADLGQLKSKYGFDPSESFAVHDDVKELYTSRGRADGAYAAWEAMFAAYATAHPELAADFDRRQNNILPANWKDALPTFPAAEEKKAIGTRNHSQMVLNGAAGSVPELVGGSADLTPSNLTNLTCSGDFQADTPAGRYIRFGVREHAMAAICNGMFAHGGVRPFCATFLNFIGYAMGSVRLSALSKFGVIYVMTHDSIGLGEDGPTHQPIETLEMLRATPNLLTFRPCDGNEVAGSYICAVENTYTPSVISLSRQTAAAMTNSSAEKVAHGAYTIFEAGSGDCKLIIASTGTEVQLAVKVAEAAASAAGTCVRVVSMPCWELFERQGLDYQLEVFPAGVPVMSIEAAGSHGWSKYAHAPYGMNSFGCSAPGGKVYERFGFTVENLSICAQEVINHYKHTPAESLINRVRFEIPGGH
jgi:transketolase